MPPGKPSHRVSSSCCYSGFEPLHATAFRIHTHELGRFAPAARPPLPPLARRSLPCVPSLLPLPLTVAPLSFLKAKS